MDGRTDIPLSEWKKVQAYVLSMVNKFYQQNKQRGISRDDLLQEAWMKVVQAKRTWNPAKKRCFSAWVYLLLRNGLLGFVKSAGKGVMSGGDLIEAVKAVEKSATPMWIDVLSPAANKLLQLYIDSSSPIRLQDLSQILGYSQADCSLLREELRSAWKLGLFDVA